MNKPLQPLEQDLQVLCATWAGALPPFGAGGVVADAVQLDLESMSDPGLVRTTDALARLTRDAEALLARVAGEIARRSPAELGKDGLAKQQGFLNPARLVAAATGGTVSTATKLVQVGQATATRQSLTGERMPPAHPHVAHALGKAAISVDAAAAITAMLDRVAHRAEPAQADAMERILAERAADIPLDLLFRVIREAEARLDQDGIAPREEELRAERSLHMREDQHGMLHLSAHLDPETAAPIKAAIETIVTNDIRARRPECPSRDGDPNGGMSPVVEDDRSIPQMQADALGMIARHAIGCTRMPAAPSMAVVVRTDLNSLTTGVGHGQIDGLNQPVSAGTIRKMAATASIIPAVLAGDSLPLDLGRDNRLFSWPQRIALAERDGGCASCGLAIKYTEAHHIDWWKRDDGPTDLANGVLLCPPCHTRIHNDDWRIRVKDEQVWFIPPPHVDPNQTPRLGGLARYGLPQPTGAT
jgi:5-methylcytosine-specific restriction protein A